MGKASLCHPFIELEQPSIVAAPISSVDHTAPSRICALHSGLVPVFNHCVDPGVR